jgi:hypothetical protein
MVLCEQTTIPHEENRMRKSLFALALVLAVPALAQTKESNGPKADRKDKPSSGDKAETKKGEAKKGEAPAGTSSTGSKSNPKADTSKAPPKPDPKAAPASPGPK